MTDESITDRKLSRRQFVGTAAAGAAALGAVAGAASFIPHAAAMPSAGGSKATDAASGPKAATGVPLMAQGSGGTTLPDPWLPANWDMVAEIVVLGTGFAGLSAAIAAHDSGADVLVLEKLDQAHQGGSSRASYNGFYASSTVAGGASYIQGMAMGTVTDPDLFTFQAQGLIDNVAWVKYLGGNIGVLTTGGNKALPDGANVTMYGEIPPGQTKAGAGGGYLWQVFSDAAAKRGIPILYNTPGTELIQNWETGEILGVWAKSNGANISIMARKAVVLACGGYEYNHDIWAEHVDVPSVYGVSCPGNTGDGILMARKVGADVWHYGNQVGGNPTGIVVPDYGYPIANLTGVSPIANNYVWVNKLGNRYVNEKSALAGINMAVSSSSGTHLSVPAWLIFDDTARGAGPILNTSIKSGWFIWYSGWTWSSDNSAEIAKGWITQADTIAHLADAIIADPDDVGPLGQPLMTESVLQATVTRWNGFVTAGADADFNRSASTLAAIKTAPFYAVKLWPTVAATEGGPRRNIKCQIVDPDLNPIPRLYSAGELGSFQGPISQGGGHLGEGMFTGRTAGTNAAAERNWM